MSNIQDLFQQAQLAEAAYAIFLDSSGNLLTNKDDIKAALQDQGNSMTFSDAQATAFINDWRVVDQYTNSSWGGLVGTGFSATVFERLDENGNGTGEYSLAIRGSQDAADFIADTKLITTGGVAVSQLVDLYNYWMRLTSAGIFQEANLSTQVVETGILSLLYAGQSAEVPDALSTLFGGTATLDSYDVARSLLIANGYIVEGGTAYKLEFVDSVGSNILPSNAVVSVTGHSLGGHLAMAFSRLFSDSTVSATAVNGLGFKVSDGNVDNLFAQLHGAPGFDAGKIQNVYGINGPEFASMNNGVLQQPGLWDGIYIESASPLPPIWGGHGGSQMTDSLALYDLFSDLDPTLSLDEITGILEAASADPSKSLEVTLDKLRTLFEQDYKYGVAHYNADPTLVGDGATARDDYYTKLYALQETLKSLPFTTFTIESLAGQSSAQLAQLAQTDPAYRYALLKLNPFAVAGATVLYDAINSQHELDLYDPATGQGELTSEYLRDRAILLVDLIAAGNADQMENGSPWLKTGGAPQYFEDNSGYSQTRLYLGADKTVTAQPLDAMSQIKFGGWLDDTLSGGSKWDRLYGMAGDDTLTGKGGNDHLEGGRGYDHYVINAGDGYDTILDTDGMGVVTIGEIDAKGSATNSLDLTKWIHTTGSDVWTDQLNNITYTKSIVNGEAQLLIHKGDTNIVVKGWVEDELGIKLGASSSPTAAPLPSTTGIISGDLKPVDTNPAAAGIQIRYDSLGNVIVNSEVDADRADTLYDSAVNDHLQGMGGNDDILAERGGDDILDGGAGDDLLLGYGGADALIGGGGSDVLRGWTDDDQLYGSDQVTDLAAYILAGETQEGTGQTGDWLSGDDGSDTLVGDTANDVLLGGTGEDLVIGGAGDDFIKGDDYGQAERGWTLMRELITDGDHTTYQPNITRGWVAPSPSGDADVIYGGAGDDWINGNGGNDIVDGGADNDTVWGGEGDDVLLGQNGDDTLLGDNGFPDTETGGHDVLYGGEGKDKLWGNGGNDLLDGGADDDYLAGGYGDDILNGGTGNDTLYGQDEDDYLDGGEGTDSLYGGAGNDTLVGEAGETMVGGEGDDTYIINGVVNTVIDDNEGENLLVLNDVATLDPAMLSVVDNGAEIVLDIGNGQTIRFSSGLGSTITLQAQDGSTLSLQAWAAENITDPLVLAQGDTGGTLYGGAGDDVLNGGSGNDTLLGQGGNDTLNGNAGNDTLDGGGGDDFLNGGTGDDVYLVSDYSDSLNELSGEGTDTVRSSVTHTLGGNLENLELVGSENIDGTGNELDNALIGNAGNNVLAGGAGNDSLNGGLGTDTLAGGTGDDVYIVADNADVLVEVAGEGTDTVVSSVSYALGDNIERLELAGSENIDGTGNALDNVVIGNSSNNTLAGGGGRDILGGGAGDDTYIVTDNTDVLSESSGNGFDTVQSFVTYTLPTNIERLELAGTASINGTGNDLDNVLIGNDGINKLMGGKGDDTYIISDLNDNLVELSGEGTDTVMSSVSYALQNYFENLTLTGSANINGSGHNGGNRLTGNDGNNTLSGGNGNDVLDGGAGADILKGGDDNDIYIINDELDVIIDSGGGSDTAMASVSYALDSALENLILTGTAAINGSGNSDNNVITGNSGNNTLQGFSGNDTLDGGAGADILVGGRDHDAYVVDDAGDVVKELADEGTDRVQSSISYTLTANVENLLLTGNSPINGTGNFLNNTITGNSGDNVLDGGSGADTLQGGAGNDLYFVDNSADKINELAGEGTEQVMASANYALSVEVENLTLIEGSAAQSATGNELNNILIGNRSNNTLAGNGGDDFIDGGAGADVMKGGFGDDIFIVDNAGDTVSDSDKKNIGTDLDPIWVHGGTDTVLSSVSFAISNFVENLILTGTDAINGSGSGGNENITGNGANNILTGNGGNDILDGGAGADRLIGGNGNDTLVVDEIGDVVVELSGQGTDTVVSSISYALANDLENLTLTGPENLNGTGNNVNNVLIGNEGINTLAGKLGNDSYHVQNSSDTVVELANEGTDTVFSTVNYVLGANVENLTLTGTKSVSGTGNTLNNTITGNIANNILDGGAGSDTMIGGNGDDTYIIDNTGDRITEVAGEGTDTVQIAMSYTLGNNLENLTLTGSASITGSGNTLNNVLIGNEGNNTLTGGDGHDTMYGGGGADILKGGSGNDTYVIDDLSDTLSEGSSAGTDTVQSSITYTLLSNFENLVLTGTANINGTGSGVNNLLIGNSGSNTLSGLNGDDTLDGGAGADTLIGGAGNDTYVVDNADDVVVETSGEGTDTVQSYISLTLGANIERLALIGTAAINGTGNALGNVITGNAGSNMLDGGGGTDSLYGGYGDDTYIINNTSTSVFENASEGNDTVQSSISYTLGANLENLALTGTNSISGTGNGLNNILTGNSANNILSGGDGNDILNGMEGADSMNGGFGDDIYIVDNGADVANDVQRKNIGTDLDPIYVDGGTDTVLSSVSFSLSTYMENLTLTGQNAANGTGNGLNNVLTGNSEANTLSGLSGNDRLEGGAGADTLNGGTGNDTYLAGRGDGADVIQDYQSTANTDILSFGPDISAEQIWFQQSGNDLEISIIGTQDSVTIQGWYLGSAYHVEQITLADGNVLLDGQVQALVDAMAAFSPPPEGQSTLPQNYQSVLLGFIDASWTLGTSASASTTTTSTSSTDSTGLITSIYSDSPTTVSSGAFYA